MNTRCHTSALVFVKLSQFLLTSYTFKLRLKLEKLAVSLLLANDSSISHKLSYKPQNLSCHTVSRSGDSVFAEHFQLLGEEEIRGSAGRDTG